MARLTIQAFKASDRGNSSAAPQFEREYEQEAAEKILRKSKNWRLKEGQGFVFLDNSIVVAKKAKPDKKTEDKVKDHDLKKRVD